jgi:hypothetical protein
MKTLNTMACLFAIAAASAALAGGPGGGGGHGGSGGHAGGGHGGVGGADNVKCNGGIFSLFASKHDEVADTYAGPQINRLSMNAYDSVANADQLREALLHFLDQDEPTTASALRKALSELNWVKVTDLSSPVDTGLSISAWDKILEGCSREQVAKQDFDVVDAQGRTRIRYVPEKLGQYPVLVQALAELHEARLHIAFVNAGKPANPDVPALEDEARAELARIWSLPGLNPAMLTEVVQDNGWSREVVMKAGFNILDRYLRQDDTLFSAQLPESDRSQVQSYSDAIAMYGDVNRKAACDMPLIDYAMTRQLEGTGDVAYAPASQAAKMMIDHGADLEAKDLYGRTPIIVATIRDIIRDSAKVLHDDDFMVEALRKAGADINFAWCRPGSLAGEPALTPLDVAKKLHAGRVSKMLEKLGAKRGKKIGAKCESTVPQVTSDVRKAAQCELIQGRLLWYGKTDL